MYAFKAATAYFFQLIYLFVMIRIILSWVGKGLNNQFTQFVYQITEPLLAPFRNLQQRLGVGGPLDFSPILLLLTLQLIAGFIGRM